jgi:hypothetical protein
VSSKLAAAARATFLARAEADAAMAARECDHQAAAVVATDPMPRQDRAELLAAYDCMAAAVVWNPHRRPGAQHQAAAIRAYRTTATRILGRTAVPDPDGPPPRRVG